MTKRQYTRLKFKVEITSSPFGTHEGPELHPKNISFPLHTKNLYTHFMCSYCILNNNIWWLKGTSISFMSYWILFNELLSYLYVRFLKKYIRFHLFKFRYTFIFLSLFSSALSALCNYYSLCHLTYLLMLSTSSHWLTTNISLP